MCSSVASLYSHWGEQLSTSGMAYLLNSLWLLSSLLLTLPRLVLFPNLQTHRTRLKKTISTAGSKWFAAADSVTTCICCLPSRRSADW